MAKYCVIPLLSTNGHLGKILKITSNTYIISYSNLHQRINIMFHSYVYHRGTTESSPPYNFMLLVKTYSG